MRKMSTWRLVLLAPVLATVGLLVALAAPGDTRAIGTWPVGLATGVLLHTRARQLAVMTPIALALALVTVWLSGRPGDVAVGFALAIVVECLLTRWWLLREGGVPTLRTVRQLVVYLEASLAGALTGATLSGLTSWATGWERPGVVFVAVGVAHLASQLVVLPFFMSLHRHDPRAGRPERAAQWLTLVVLTPLVLWTPDFSSLAFLVIPVLGWGALRVGPRESLVQMASVLGFAIAMTAAGQGPFATVRPEFGLPTDARGIMLATFAITTALVVVPLLLAVGEQIDHAEEAAAERDKLERIVNGATGVAIIGTDDQHRVTLFNPGAERLLGFTAEEMLGGNTVHLHSREAISAKSRELGVPDDFLSVARAMALPQNAGTDIEFIRKDGEVRMHLMTLTRLQDARGQLLGHVSTSEDVTERVRAERALHEALEVERQAVERLREVDSVKDAFVSSVSHELRTPITSILGYLEMLEDGSFGQLGPRQLDAVRRVGGNSTRLLGLIDDLLTLSRLHEVGLEPGGRAFDLRSVVSSGYSVVVPTCRTRHLDLALALPDEPVPFVGDRDMVERVVVNLVGNAVKFTPDGGRVSADLSVTDGEAVLVVKDTGIGIPDAEQDHLFTRFFRSTTAQERAIPGSGLGLSITRAIVEKHGGTVALVSSDDSGSAFEVRVPVVG